MSIIEDGQQQVALANLSAPKLPPKPIISHATYAVVLQSFFYAYIPICILGMLTNIFNITVFYRMGFVLISNMSLFALAIADLISATTILMRAVTFHPAMMRLELVFPTRDIMFLAIPIYHCSSAFGSWVTAIISVERSLCVVFPIKVKMIFTRKLLVWLLVGMLVFQLTGIPQYTSITIAARVSPVTNRTLYYIDYARFNMVIANLAIFISFSLPTLICFIVVTIATIFLVIRFKQSLQVRKKMSGKEGETISAKDAVMIRSVIFICIIYIVGYFPSVVIFLYNNIDSSFHPFDPVKGNLMRVVLSVSHVTQALCYSANIFVYFTMSSKFKETFTALFSC